MSEAVTAEAGFRVGDVFLGKYRIESILGQGGMGVVAKCVHLGLDETFAIKMLRPDILAHPEAQERFMREAQAAGKLKSEHVARVIDVGTSDAGVPYMIMEYLDGRDLGQLVDDHGAVQAPLAALLMLQAAEGLCDAHSHNIIHRDIKPSNLFVTRRPDGSPLVKVLDFGISKSTETTSLRLTQTQSLLGTPAHMSPEQMRSARQVDARSDIWSLGTVFYELLEGRPPFVAESFSEMCIKVVTEPPAPMVNAPPELEAIVMRCLEKDLGQRYQTVAELGRDLLPHVHEVHQATLLVERMERMANRPSAAGIPITLHDLGSQPIPVRVATNRSSPIAVARPASTSNIAPPTRPRSRLLYGALGALGATAIAVGAAFAITSSKNEQVHTVSTEPPPLPAPPTPVVVAQTPDAEAPPVLPSPKEAAPAPPGEADLAKLAPFEQLASLSATKPPCRSWNAEALRHWDRGVFGAVQRREELVTKPPFDQGALRDRLDAALAVLVSTQATCDAKKPGVKVARGGTRCPAGQHLTPAGCADAAPTPVVEPPPPPPPPLPPPPPPTGGRSPNGKCSLADRLPSGNWPPGCQ